jgi:hypothetical protein
MGMRRLVLALLIAIFIAPAVSAVIAACGSVAASDVLAGDISGAGTCLTVTADNVEIDCLGFTIEYKTGGGVNGFGITASYRANITIRNCNIIAGSSAGAFGHALQLLNITNMTLVNSNISTNGTFANFGMNVTNSTNFTVFNNSILASSSTTTAGSFGMQFSGSRLINVTSNRIFTYFDDSNFGVSLQTVNHTLVANNLVRTGNLSSNFGIFVQNMLNVTIIDNDIVTTGDFSNFGILASTTASLEFGNVSISGNNITTWTSESSNFGIDIEGLNGVTIQNNTIRTNGSDSNFGIITTDFLGLLSRNITIQSNSMVTDGSDCCNYGVNIDGTENATVAWNVILTNGSECCNDGVITTGSTFNITIANNSIRVNGTPAFSINIGVDLFGGPNTTVSGNNITTNGTSINEGIFTNEDNTTIINNFIITDGTDDTNWGIQAFTALYVNVINNTIFTNGTFSNIGIEFDGFTDHGIIANNTIYTDGTVNDNHGIQFDGTSNNSVSGNHIFTSGTNSYGINITASSNITFNNNILNNTVQWIFSHTTGFANYTNTTFFMLNGSIRYNDTFALAGLNNITHDVLNISFNNSFVNSTAEPELNTTAFITLNGLPFADPKPVVDYEDDGIFTDCNENCTEVSYSGGNFEFNVSHFTNFSVSENGSIGCPLNVSTSTILTSDLNCPATAVNVTGNDLVFSCGGYSIYYANGSTGFGVNVTNSTNVTIEDCTIVSLNFTSGSNVAINFTNSNNTIVRNTTLKPHGLNSNHGIAYVRGSQNGTIENNTILTNGTAATNNGIFLSSSIGPGSPAYINFTIRNNTILTNGTITNGGISATTGRDLIIINNSIAANGSSGSSTGVDLTATNDSMITNNSIYAGLDAGPLSAFNEGINLVLSNHINITNNTISANGIAFNRGIDLSLSSGNASIEDNSINAFANTVASVGIFITTGDNNTIAGNIITANATNNTNGINLTATNDNFVINNTIFVNSSDDSTLGPSNGIALNNSGRNNVSGNVISTILAHGINLISGGTTNNVLNNNSIAVFATLGTVYGIHADGFSFRAPRNNITTNNIIVNTTNAITLSNQADHYFIMNNTLTVFNGSVSFAFTTDSASTINNLTFANNSIQVNGGVGNRGISLDGSIQNSTIANNTIVLNTTGTLNRGIFLTAVVGVNQRNNTFFNNSINVNGSGGTFGILINARSVGNNVFNHTNITLTGSVTSIFGIAIAGNNTFDNTFLNDPVSWVNQTNGTIQTISNFTNTTFFVPGNGSIRFNGTFQINGTENITKEKLDIDFNQSRVNSTNLTFLNTTAQITLNGLPFADPKPVVDYEDDGTFAACSSPQCDEVNYAGGIFVFNVSSFTSYAATEGSAPENISFIFIKNDSQDPVNVSSTLNYTITLEVNGTAYNISLTDIYPAGVSFVSASPAPDVGNNTWIIGNLTNSSFEINITITIGSSFANGTVINNTANISFQNSSGGIIAANVTENTTVEVPPAPPPPPSGGGGGGGGRGGTASVCDTLCQSPLYENSPQCLRCKQVQQPTCIEQWKCDAWSDCTGGQQFRSCQDIVSCGTYTFRPATQQACGPQTEKPTYQPELTIGTEETAEQVESAPETVTRKQATKTLDIAGISISSKHAPVIAGVLLLYAILLVFIVWHNRHKHAHKKK